MESQIIPYPGPRSFNQDEALFFKGREQYLAELTDKLGKNHFLMITGSSGDGKSSLVFAGLIPHANAGFLKSKYPRWKFVSFRPERDPMHCIAESLYKILGFNKAEDMYSKLKGGYSSLIDIYKTSPLFTDDRKKGFNLLILADQFEEFFTNPENYKTDSAVATPQAQLAVQLLLETSRLARQQDIPIYIVCTMRSDYFGHCTAFNGLPSEMVLSQFYLERLTRSEMLKVIKEPAELFGIEISENLLSTLINEISDDLGMDILPILQHCLYQIFMISDMGKQKMDMLHYAMVGGISPYSLTPDDRQKYDKWFNALSEAEKKQLENPSLRNVLDTHATRLFENAHHYFNEKLEDNQQSAIGNQQSAIGNQQSAIGSSQSTIIDSQFATSTSNIKHQTSNELQMSKEEAQHIIEVAYKCLTRIDENKPVRNLATLAEITAMLGNSQTTNNKQQTSSERVGKLLDIYRIHGNTFLRPFVTKDPATHSLKPETVLDITHEALMRNWQKLDDWAWEEYRQVLVYRDLCKQLDKWLKSGKKREYLLPGGSLKYFENWYKAQVAEPIAWLSRYYTPEEDIKDIKEDIKDIKEDIKEKTEDRSEKLEETSLKFEVGSLKLEDSDSVEVKEKNNEQQNNRTIEQSNDKQQTTNDKQNPANPVNPVEKNINPVIDRNSRSFRKLVHQHFADLQQYLSVSRSNINRLNRIRTTVISSISALLIVSVIALVWAINLKGKVETAKLEIEQIAHSNTVATKAYTTLEKDPTLAFRIAEQAYQIYPTALATQVLFAAYGEIPFYKKLSGHKESVKDCKISPNGKYIATFSADNTGIIWDFAGNKLAELKGHTATYNADFDCMNFSPDNKYIVTGTNDSTARLWLLHASNNQQSAMGNRQSADSNNNHGNQNNQSKISGSDNFPQATCLAIMKHNNKITSVSFSPVPINLPVNFAKILKSSNPTNPSSDKGAAEQFILTSSYDSTARLWNLQGQELLKIKHKNSVWKAIFSPNGKQIATMCATKTAYLWDIDGKLISELKGHKEGIYGIIFSPDNNYIVTISDDKTARLYDLKGNFKAELKGHEKWIQSADISLDNKYIVTSSIDNTIRLWDFSGKELAIMRKHIGYIWSVKFSHNGKYIVSASDDGTARLWDLNGTELMVLKGHTASVLAAEFSPDDIAIVTASSDKTARIWNIQPMEYPVMRGHSGPLQDINQSADGKYIATAAWDYTARLWENLGKQLQIFNYPYYPVINTSNFLNKSKKIVIQAGMGGLVIYDFKGKELHKIKTHGHYNSLDISKNDNLLRWSDAQKATLYDTTGKKLQEFKDVSSAGFIAESPQYIKTTGLDSTLYFWQDVTQSSGLQNNEPEARVTGKDTSLYQIFHKINLGKQTSAFFSDNLKYMLTLSEDSTARLWDFQEISNQQSAIGNKQSANGNGQLANGNKQSANGNGQSANGNGQSAIGNKQSAISNKQSADSNKQQTTNNKQQTGLLLAWKYPNQITSALFAPDNLHFAIVDDKNQILIYDVSEVIGNRQSAIGNGQEAIGSSQSTINDSGSATSTSNLKPQTSNNLHTCIGHSDAINDLNFSPDSRYIVSGSNDFSFILWSIEGELIQTYNMHKAGVYKAKFTIDGKYILTASFDQTARITPVSIQMVFDKINKQKIRGDVEQLTEDELKVFGIK